MKETRKAGNGQGERESGTPALFMGVASISVGLAFNVKPVLSFTRFKGVVTARNHAARVRTGFALSLSLWNPLKCPRFSTPDFKLIPPRLALAAKSRRKLFARSFQSLPSTVLAFYGSPRRMNCK